jgi:hypothetical protein
MFPGRIQEFSGTIFWYEELNKQFKDFTAVEPECMLFALHSKADIGELQEI